MVTWSMTSRYLKRSRSCPAYTFMQIYRKPSEIASPFQRTTNKKWRMANRMVTWLKFKMVAWCMFALAECFFSSYHKSQRSFFKLLNKEIVDSRLRPQWCFHLTGERYWNGRNVRLQTWRLDPVICVGEEAIFVPAQNSPFPDFLWHYCLVISCILAVDLAVILLLRPL